MRQILLLSVMLLNSLVFAQNDLSEMKSLLEERLGFKFTDITLYSKINSDLWFSNEGKYLKKGIVIHDIKPQNVFKAGKTYEGMSFCTIQNNGWMSYEKATPCYSEEDFIKYILESLAEGKTNLFITNNLKDSRFSPRINRLDLSKITLNELKKQEQKKPEDDSY